MEVFIDFDQNFKNARISNLYSKFCVSNLCQMSKKPLQNNRFYKCLITINKKPLQ